MINLAFVRGTENLGITIIGKSIMITVMKGNVPMTTTIDGLKLDPIGIVKEFPDLKDKPTEEMRIEAIKRFKDKLKSLKGEDDIMVYLQEDLGKFGYELKLIQKKGFRPEIVK